MEDPSRFSPEKINHADLFNRCCKVLNDFEKAPAFLPLFSAANPPKNAWVSSRQYCSSTFLVSFPQLFDIIFFAGELQGVVLYATTSS
jgi:hypothetical protein